MAAPKTLSERIAAEIRAEMAWQQRTTQGLATALGLGVRATQRRYSGEVEFGLDEIVAVADWLDVSREQLLTGSHRSAVA